MAKLPYGGLTTNPKPLDSWGFLKEIAESLREGKLVNPQLAIWLAEAIIRSNKNSTKFLIELSLKTPRGGFSSNPKNWLIYGKQLHDFEEIDGLKKEDAINKVLELATPKDGRKEPFSRATLQNWRKKYLAALKEHNDINHVEIDANK